MAGYVREGKESLTRLKKRRRRKEEDWATTEGKEGGSARKRENLGGRVITTHVI